MVTNLDLALRTEIAMWFLEETTGAMQRGAPNPSLKRTCLRQAA